MRQHDLCMAHDALENGLLMDRPDLAVTEVTRVGNPSGVKAILQSKWRPTVVSTVVFWASKQKVWSALFGTRIWSSGVKFCWEWIKISIKNFEDATDVHLTSDSPGLSSFMINLSEVRSRDAGMCRVYRQKRLTCFMFYNATLSKVPQIGCMTN